MLDPVLLKFEVDLLLFLRLVIPFYELGYERADSAEKNAIDYCGDHQDYYLVAGVLCDDKSGEDQEEKGYDDYEDKG